MAESTLSLRIKPDVKTVLEMACEMSGMSKTTFMERAIYTYALEFGVKPAVTPPYLRKRIDKD